MDDPQKKNLHKWGWSQHLLVTPQVDVAIAVGRKGGCSSWHLHQHKGNTFIVQSGKVLIEWNDCDLHENGHITLCERDSHTVWANDIHRMTFLEDSTLYEVYVADPGQTIDLADIVRLDEGTEPEAVTCSSQPSSL